MIAIASIAIAITLAIAARRQPDQKPKSFGTNSGV
jgi:hypothetical protein